ncbi:TetR/AcrR family transcriptional regulator [Bradyrhizobium sp. 2S1]|uniref:TetR/AcrR family transcriptional regulator n=1 Tax=Bradyrhizobium sp. 2S1 TaxID=1404429 RepID=UPI00140C9BA1|nr:TetR/AcrR family transcriptional regulator [Bradyrhizobium sp. 2S1]MCK7668461.1 TetR/AcrR family transcriptional regulator [Bradyrhizobium sp. 2S1]
MPAKRRMKARKQPLQQRSRETVAVILEAAARVLEQRGLEGYNTNAVAERGGISVGSVYQYFPNKDALTLALIARFEDALLAKVRDAVTASEGKSLTASLNLIIRAQLEAHAERAGLNRILETEEDRLRPASSDSSAASELKELVAALLARHRRQIARPVDDEIIEDLIVISRAMVDHALQQDLSHAAANRRVLRAIEGYLFGPHRDH